MPERVVRKQKVGRLVDPLMLKQRSSSSRPDQAIRPRFAWADKLDVAGKAEGFEFVFVFKLPLRSVTILIK